MGVWDLISIQWWLEHLVESYEREPGHVLVELAALLTIIYLLFRQSYDPQKANPLSEREQDALISEWNPAPLCPPMTEQQKEFSKRATLVVESGPGRDGQLTIGGKQYLNFASYNFMGIADNDNVQKACKETISKYGVGSCGPRGFYGSIDVHLTFEEEMAKFVGVEEAIFYSDAMACVSSVIPAFSKRGDLIICDESAHFGIQQGINLSRSNVLYYKHNDMEDLERILSDVDEKHLANPGQKLTRRFIVAEGISEYHGDVCPLNKLVQLKNKYKYRLILDDSLAFGVLGSAGRGTPDHFNIKMQEISFYVVTCDKTLSTVGGLCMGEKAVIDHQRLSGAGYCFSASAPPYVATAGTVNLKLLDTMKDVFPDLRSKAELNRKNLLQIDGVVCSGDNVSPLAHLRLQRSLGSELEDQLFWVKVQAEMREHDILVDVPCYIPAEKQRPAPSLRVMVSTNHKKTDIEKLSTTLSTVIREQLETYHKK